MALHALRARYVFPVAGPPIPDGVVTIDGPQIAAVGDRPAGGDVDDLGNVAIVPGLVNAHTHLDLSDVPEPLGRPGVGFADWIRQVIAHRVLRMIPAERALESGLRESVRQGTTTLGDIAQPGWTAEPMARAAMDATVFLELIAPGPDRIPLALEHARCHVRSAQGCRPGLSPHAPYSVHPELLRQAVSLSSEARVPIAFHLAESPAELELLRSGTGPLRELLDDLQAWEPGAIPAGTRPLDYLRLLTQAHRTLVIHGNYLDADEIGLLGQHADRMAAVYCPRTHAFFQHSNYPLSAMLLAGATVALGTDSRASSPDLSILSEMRWVAQRHPGVAPEVVLGMGTHAGAKALGRGHEVGTLEVGKLADLTVIALPDRHAADPYELLFDSDGPVVGRYYRGECDDDP